MALAVIPGNVIWSYAVGGVIFAIGVMRIFLRGDWQKERGPGPHGLDRLILFAPVFYAVPIAAFGTEHFTRAMPIASIIPAWIPWHLFWTYLVGTCFIAAGLSLVTGIQTRLAASLLALTFFLFVVLMDLPGWLHKPQDRFATALVLRELSFSAGPLALAASLTANQRLAHIQATIARYFIAIALLYYSFEQFLHGYYVPGVPLERVTPAYIFGHSIWTYLAAVVYAIAGVLLLINRNTRAAATWSGATVLLVVLAVYVPIGIVDLASLDMGLNYLFDTLMFCGAVLMLGGAMPRSEPTSSPRIADAIESEPDLRG